jgi:hypothetical protein
MGAGLSKAYHVTSRKAALWFSESITSITKLSTEECEFVSLQLNSYHGVTYSEAYNFQKLFLNLVNPAMFYF